VTIPQLRQELERRKGQQDRIHKDLARSEEAVRKFVLQARYCEEAQ